MAEFLTEKDRRTHYCGTLNESNIGETVSVMGWVQRCRDLGALVFVDLRDRTGILQLAFDGDSAPEIFEKARRCRAEYVIACHGVVRARGEGAVNKNIPTGGIEINVTELKVLSAAQTPPIEVSDTKRACAVPSCSATSKCATIWRALPVNTTTRMDFMRSKRP